MKFFNLILISSYPTGRWAYPDGAQDNPAPFHRLYFLCSILHNQLPRNADPNTVFPRRETPVGATLMCAPLASLPSGLYSMRVHTQHADERDPCSLHPSVSEHSQHYISVLPNHGNEPERPPSAHDTDTWSPKRCVLSSYLPYGNSFYYSPYRKTK